MKNFRTIAALSLFALGSVAAHAQSSGAFGDNSNYPAAASTASALTRQAVIADLQAARANGGMPHDAEGSDVAYSAAAVHCGYVTPDNFYALDLIEHDVFQTHSARGVLLGDGNTIHQHEDLQRGSPTHENGGLTTSPATLSELKTSLTGQQTWQIEDL